jgi:hypothetical protein
MSGRPAAARGGARVLLVDGGRTHDIFDVVEVADTVARVRTAFLFELGEELRLRVEQGGAAFEAPARVLAHVGTGAEKITELELGDRVAVP